MRPKKISNEDILEVVRSCMLEQGSSVSTKVIADNLGISQATLFKRFGTKIQLLQAALAIPNQARIFLKKLETYPTTEAPFREQLIKLSLEMLSFFDEMIPCWATLHSAGITFPKGFDQESPPIRARKALTKWLAFFQQTKQIRDDIKAESIAVALIGAIQHRPFRIHVVKDHRLSQSAHQYVESTVDIILSGLIIREQS